MKSRDRILEAVRAGFFTSDVIAARIGLSVSAVNSALRQLAARGELERERINNKNHYTITDGVVIEADDGYPALLVAPWTAEGLERVLA